MKLRTNTAVWLDKYERWQINVQKDNKRRSFTSSTKGKAGQREANAKADAWLDENITDQNMRIETLFDEYIEGLKITTSKSNWIKLEQYGANWIKPEIGAKKIGKVSEQDLQNIIDKAFSKGLAKKTLSNIRGATVSFMKFCRKKKVTTLFPEDLTIPKGAKVSQKQILQPDDLITLFSVDTTVMRSQAVQDEFINAYRFQILTGLRPGELMGLEWCDITDGVVYINRSLNAYGEITQGKNENAVRHFVLTNRAKEILEEQKIISKSNSVFGLDSLSTYSKRWARYCESNSIPHISLYEMRHTFVSIAKNLPNGQIRPIIGHSKNMDTFGTYGHELSGELTSTAETLGELFENILQPKTTEDVETNNT